MRSRDLPILPPDPSSTTTSLTHSFCPPCLCLGHSLILPTARTVSPTRMSLLTYTLICSFVFDRKPASTAALRSALRSLAEGKDELERQSNDDDDEEA